MLHLPFHLFVQEPEVGGDVIPPLSDCVQLSVEQYRNKLYDIIRQEKVARWVQFQNLGYTRYPCVLT